MTAWRSVAGSGATCRTWTSIPGPIWCYNTNGDITASWGGVDYATSPRDVDLALARQVIPVQVPLLQQAGADNFYTRALLAIGMHESGFILPSAGDCRIGGKVVVCGSPGADAPRSIGYYQFLRSTADSIGASWDSLAASPEANHKAGLSLGRSSEAQHGGDIIALATIWGAGSVRPSATGDWGVVTWQKDTLTQFARYWNAAGIAMREAWTPVAVPGGGGGGSSGIAVGAVVAAGVVLGGLWLRSQGGFR